MKKISLFVSLLLISLALVFVLGCSEKRYSLSGKVTNVETGDGVGNVAFFSVDNAEVTRTNNDGIFNTGYLYKEMTIKPEKVGWTFNPRTIKITGKDDVAVVEATPKIKDKIIIEDKNLEDYIRDEIKKTSGDIYYWDVDDFDDIQFSGFAINEDDKKIKDLSGIENLLNLRHLELSHHKIITVPSLKQLMITVIDLSNNVELNSLDFIEDCDFLENLNVNYTSVTEIDDLKSLKKLYILSLSNTKITDFTPLSSIKTLGRLDLSDTDIDDLSVLKDLPNLEDLNIVGCEKLKIKDLEVLLEFKALEKLTLSISEEDMENTIITSLMDNAVNVINIED